MLQSGLTFRNFKITGGTADLGGWPSRAGIIFFLYFSYHSTGLTCRSFPGRPELSIIFTSQYEEYYLYQYYRNLALTFTGISLRCFTFEINQSSTGSPS